jgi:hypothetical protein
VFGRHDNSRDFFKRRHIVGSWSFSSNINVVVVAFEKTSLIKVEGLLSRVSGDICRKRDFQAAPGFPVFLPRLDFFGLNTSSRYPRSRWPRFGRSSRKWTGPSPCPTLSR